MTRRNLENLSITQSNYFVEHHALDLLQDKEALSYNYSRRGSGIFFSTGKDSNNYNIILRDSILKLNCFSENCSFPKEVSGIIFTKGSYFFTQDTSGQVGYSDSLGYHKIECMKNPILYYRALFERVYRYEVWHYRKFENHFVAVMPNASYELVYPLNDAGRAYVEHHRDHIKHIYPEGWYLIEIKTPAGKYVK